jgi:hypothetical protein
MSDSAQPNPAVANATQALAVKEANGRIDALAKQIKILWAVVAVVGILALVSAAFTLLPRFFGVRLGGGFQTRPSNLNGQQFNGGQFNGNTGGGGGTQQVPQTTPAQ